MTNANMTNNTDNSEKNEDLILLAYYYLSLLKKYYKQILGFSGVITLAAAIFTLSLTPIYQATTSILIESQESKAISVEEVVRVNKSHRAFYNTQYEIFKSRKLADLVVKKLDLKNHPLFKSENYSESQIASVLISNLSINPLRETYLVYISFKSPDPELAAEVANAYADAYIEHYLESKLTSTIKAQSWLSGRLSNLRLKLEESERKLSEYTEKENLIDVNGVKSMAISQHEQLTGQLIDLRKNKTTAQNIYDQLKSLANSSNTNNADSSTKELLSVSTILNQPIIQQLKSQESTLELKIAELSNRYGPLHPKMKSAQAELISTRENLDYQVKNLVRVYEKELDVSKETERSILQQIQTSSDEIKRINNKNYELTKLEREVEVNKELYNLFLTRESETYGISGFEAPPVIIVDPARPSHSPIAPSKKLIILAALFLSLLIACALIVLYDLLDNTVKTPNDVEQKLRSHLLGILPLIKISDSSNNKGAFKGFIDDKTSSFAESVRTIRTGLLLSSLNEKNKIVMISSTIPGEGKSTVTTNLAATLGQMKKTLIIEADLRRPTLGKTFNIDKNAPGLSSIIAGTHQLDECIIKNVTDGVDLLVSGIIPPNPLELISSLQFKNLLEKCSENYEHIVIDSAPTQSVSDSLVLAQFADLFIFVVKADSTNASIVRKSLEHIQKTGVKLAGVVLNQVDVDNNLYYSTNHYGNYYQSIPYGDLNAGNSIPDNSRKND